MAMNKVNDEFKDDGRTVADMDIPGMPWYAGPNDRLGDRPKAKRNSLVEERIAISPCIRGRLFLYFPIFRQSMASLNRGV